jgi:hypothetical protein
MRRERPPGSQIPHFQYGRSSRKRKRRQDIRLPSARLGCNATTTARADSKRSSCEFPQAKVININVTNSGLIRHRDACQGRAIAFALASKPKV